MAKAKPDPRAAEVAAHVLRTTGMSPKRLYECAQAILSCLEGMSQVPPFKLLISTVRLETYARFTEREVHRTLLMLISEHVVDLDQDMRPYLGEAYWRSKRKKRGARGPAGTPPDPTDG